MKHYQTGIARKFLFLMVGLLCAIGATAQSITVRGTVVDPSGEPLIGASILAEGTSVGTATDIGGNYAINVNPDATLVFSYVGYDPQSVAVKGRTTIDVTMKENSVMLNEVVAIGYGVVKKSDATGSVAVVKPDEIEAGLATSVQDMLVGQTPGVVVTTAGGPEGGASIRVRGGSSLNASNDPLIVLDGVPLDNGGVQGMGNPLAMISPENIESMTILKDASATAIYGARASNGVIIVTTKRGKSGKPQINFSANMYINHAHKRWDVLSADEFRNLIVERFGENSDAANALGDTSTDWQDEVLRTTVSSDYSLSIGGTAGVLPYHANISYTNSNGIIKTSKMDRLTLGFNLSPKFFQDHLSVNANVKGFYVRNQFGDAGALSSAISYDPTHPVRSDLPIVGGTSGQKYMFNGFYEVANVNSEGVVQLNDNASLNPVGMLENKDNYANVYRSNGNLQLDYSMHFLPELHANLNLGYDVSKTNETNATAANSAEAWKNHEHYGGGYKTDTYQFKSNTMLEFYLNYKKEFDAASQMVDVVGGYTWQRTYNEGHYSGANGNAGVRTSPGLNYPTLVDGKYYMDQNDATVDLVGKPFQADGISSDGNYHWKDHLQLLSFYGRVNYGLLDRYLLTFTVRGDATSRFSKNNRWGVFPAAALAWKLNNEAFLESASGWLSDLKLRLSWGQTGQQEVGSSINYMPMYAIASPSVSYPNGLGGWYLPVYARGYNPDLTWETTTSYNAALDFGFLNNRITGNIEYYHRKTTDLLAFVAVPAGSSTTNMLNRNIGSLVNYGIEFNVQARPIVTDDFTWTVNYNVGWNHNEITELYEGSTIRTGGIAGGNGNTVQAHAVGHAANTFYLYQQVYDQAGNPIEGAYVDQNGDGQIDDADKILNKSPDPKVTMTLGNNFRYKNWDFGINFRASIGNYVYNNVLSNNINTSNLYSSYGISNVVDNDVYFSQPQYMSDYFLRNGSFLRCENITIGHTWDNLLNDNLRMRLFAGVQNPFIITKYKGIDPEVFGGIDNSVYPKAVIYTLGVVATF